MNLKSLILILFFLFSCTINPPQVEMTGEKTSLENQILGTYRQIESDTWMIASVRSKTEIENKADLFISEEKRHVLEAIQNRRFNQDDIDEFKKLGLVGESNTGYVSILERPETSLDKNYEAILHQISEEENRDRKIIMQRVISVDPQLTQKDMSEIERIFAEQNRTQAKTGEWIQLQNGTWETKK